MGTSTSAAVQRRTRSGRRPPWPAIFVGLEVLLLLLVLTSGISVLLPPHPATQVSHNSEAFLLAALLSLEIAWLRRWPVVPGPAGGAAVLAVAVALVVLGLVLLRVDEARLKTLNEAVLAAGILLVYCALRPRRPALALASAAVLALVVGYFHSDLVRLQAECLVALILAPWGFDVFARWILVPVPVRSTRPAVAWTAFLLGAPFVLMALDRGPSGSVLADAIEYAARGNEAFWGLGAVHLLALFAWRGPGPVLLEGAEGVGTR